MCLPVEYWDNNQIHGRMDSIEGGVIVFTLLYKRDWATLHEGEMQVHLSRPFRSLYEPLTTRVSGEWHLCPSCTGCISQHFFLQSDVSEVKVVPGFQGEYCMSMQLDLWKIIWGIWQHLCMWQGLFSFQANSLCEPFSAHPHQNLHFVHQHGRWSFSGDCDWGSVTAALGVRWWVRLAGASSVRWTDSDQLSVSAALD